MDNRCFHAPFIFLWEAHNIINIYYTVGRKLAWNEKGIRQNTAQYVVFLTSHQLHTRGPQSFPLPRPSTPWNRGNFLSSRNRRPLWPWPVLQWQQAEGMENCKIRTKWKRQSTSLEEYHIASSFQRDFKAIQYFFDEFIRSSSSYVRLMQIT